MVTWLMVLGIVLSNGQNAVQAYGYKSLDECKAEVAKMHDRVAHANAKGEVQITYYTASCAQLKKVPKGDEI